MMKRKRKTITTIDSSHPHPEIALIGQPNCGKSTLFNSVAGYRSISTNFPGATVKYTRSHVAIGGRKCNLIDLPGIYSLIAMDRAAEETKKYVLSERIDVIINVVDASILSRSLELTIQLLELDIPLVICLNMMDEAKRKGIEIDSSKLSRLLNIPVVETIASKGFGVNDLFSTTLQSIHSFRPQTRFIFSRHVEEKIRHLSGYLESAQVCQRNLKPRLAAIKLLEDDPFFKDTLCRDNESLEKQVGTIKDALVEEHGESSDAVIAAERHNLAMQWFEKVATIKHPRRRWVDHLDNLVMHPIWGYVVMVLILFGYFNAIFSFGGWLETPLMSCLNSLVDFVTQGLEPTSFSYSLIHAALQGIAGGIAIVFPYLIPFLIGMAILEDIGYLPRIAFLMDNFMHRIGLHGVAVVPGLLGYGCSVPAVMATRILSSQRDRFIASIVAILIPCSARMVVIMGLVGYYVGGTAVFAIYFLNIVVISVLGAILSKLMPEDVPGMILEIPSYHRPKVKIVLAKTWLQLRDFIYIAWPLLIVGSLILGWVEWFQWDQYVDYFTRPITWLLDLPPQVGSTLIFGILRKELSLLMLYQALGTQDVQSVMTNIQIVVFTLFVVFYIPCLATLGVMGKELGLKKTIAAVFLTLGIAVSIGTIVRFIFSIFNTVL